MPDDNYLYSEGAPAEDPRIRRVVGDYRCVAPNAKLAHSRLYLNGDLIIEKKQKDSLGNPVWIQVGRIFRPVAGKSAALQLLVESIVPNPMLEEAVYRLLAGVSDD